MKKIIAIFLAAALLAALAGCDKSGDSGSSSINTSTTQSTSTLEMEGILYVQQKDNNYFRTARDLEFFPDSNKNRYIPMWVGGDDCVHSLTLEGNHMQSDCTFQLGNIDESIISTRTKYSTGKPRLR